MTAPIGYRNPLQCSASELSDAFAALPAGIRALARSPVVSVVTGDDPSVPEEVASRIRSSGPGDIPSATMLHDDGRVQVAMGSAGSDLVHEMIHVAQVFAPRGAMEAAFSKAADAGDRLVASAEAAVAAGASLDDYRDIQSARAFVKTAIGDPEALHGSFEFYKGLHKDSGTRALAAGMGFGPEAAGALVYAAALRERGFDDPGASVSREVVAYAFQDDPGSVAPLFAAALPGAMEARVSPPSPGYLDIGAARGAVAALGQGGEPGSVGIWVSREDMDVLTIRGREGLKDPYRAALLDVLPAVRQPVYATAGGGRMFRTGEVRAGQEGAVYLFQGFGGGRSRRLWLDSERLAHRLVHLEGRGSAIAGTLREGSLSRDGRNAAARRTERRQGLGR